jgi:hypothetical protein
MSDGDRLVKQTLETDHAARRIDRDRPGQRLCEAIRTFSRLATRLNTTRNKRNPDNGAAPSRLCRWKLFEGHWRDGRTMPIGSYTCLLACWSGLIARSVRRAEKLTWLPLLPGT